MKKFFLTFTGVVTGIFQIGFLIFIIMSSFLPEENFQGLQKIRNSVETAINEIAPGMKLVSASREIIIYNGTTIEEGIVSNESIRQEALSITEGMTDSREKAKALYEWVGKNIKYDDDKAASVMSNDASEKEKDNIKSGAIVAYNKKSGICFDKACLYAAMCRENNLKVRVISGEAYDGKEYIGHAWNQVYIPEEDEWINVDTTFYTAGNYFDSSLFNEHKVDRIAGEW